MSISQAPVRLSCEFFPVNTEEGSKTLAQVRRDLKSLNFEYYSVTYGAGGSNRNRTMALVKQICEEKGPAVMPHLTCVASDKSLLIELLDFYYHLGIRHLMALRGDMPSGLYQSSEIQGAKDLVALVRERWGDEARIMVAAYPETHPRAHSPDAGVENFVEKCKAGANEAITQYFYNPDAYVYFREQVAKKGVRIPIVPGIMPITNYTQLARFSDGCGAEIPRWIRRRLEAYQDDLVSLRAFGADVVAHMCERLIAEGAPGLHFYSMNRSQGILAITKRLGWV